MELPKDYPGYPVTIFSCARSKALVKAYMFRAYPVTIPNAAVLLLLTLAPLMLGLLA